MRRKLISNFRTKSQLTSTNLSSDRLADVKKFYGWTERQLEQNVRATVDGGSRADIAKVYEQAYGKKDVEWRDVNK